MASSVYVYVYVYVIYDEDDDADYDGGSLYWPRWWVAIQMVLVVQMMKVEMVGGK